MTTFGPFESYSPCSGPIDEVYSNCVSAYENEIRDLTQLLSNLQNQIQHHENKNKELVKYTEDLKNANVKMNEELSQLERVNHHVDRQLKAIQQFYSKLTNRETQTNQDDLLLAREENKYLKSQIQDLLAMSNDSLNIQSSLMTKIHNHKAKNTIMKNKNAELLMHLQESIERENELNNQISEETSQKINIKAENKRLMLRLAETEGNLEESDYVNSRLRLKLEQSNEKQKQVNGQEMLDMSAQIVEKEAALHELELQLNDLEKTKKELYDAQNELTKQKAQYKALEKSIEDLDRQNHIME